MLGVALFASLFISCKCIAPYNDQSNQWFDARAHDGRMPVRECRITENEVTFTAHRETDLELVFEPSNNVHITCEQQTLELLSITLKFRTDHHPEMIIRFKPSTPNNMEYRVLSKMFESPATQLDWIRTDQDAVVLHALNPAFARRLDEQVGQLITRNAAFRLDWVRSLLIKKTPRTITTEVGRGWCIIYAGLPVVIVRAVYDKLNKVRRDMEVHATTQYD